MIGIERMRAAAIARWAGKTQEEKSAHMAMIARRKGRLKGGTEAEIYAKQAEIFELFSAGHKYREIAAALEIPRATVASAIRSHRLRHGLLSLMDDDGRQDTTPGCERCGLRGPHECLPNSAIVFAQQRRTHWSDSIDRGGSVDLRPSHLKAAAWARKAP